MRDYSRRETDVVRQVLRDEQNEGKLPDSLKSALCDVLMEEETKAGQHRGFPLTALESSRTTRTLCQNRMTCNMSIDREHVSVVRDNTAGSQLKPSNNMESPFVQSSRVSLQHFIFKFKLNN